MQPGGQLLCTGAGDSDTKMECLRCGKEQAAVAGHGARNHPGTCLVIADLVYASAVAGEKTGPLLRSATVPAMIATFSK